MTISLKNVGVGLLQSALGLALVLYFGDILHDEVLRPTRDKLVLGGSFGMVILGLLAFPGGAPILSNAAQTGFKLVRAGRRATDPQAVTADLELPPPESKP